MVPALRMQAGMQVPEHTWGVDIKIYLDDYADWSNEELQRQIAARDPRYVYTVDAWIRQRSYTRWALEALDASLVTLPRHCFHPPAVLPHARQHSWLSTP